MKMILKKFRKPSPIPESSERSFSEDFNIENSAIDIKKEPQKRPSIAIKPLPFPKNNPPSPERHHPMQNQQMQIMAMQPIIAPVSSKASASQRPGGQRIPSQNYSQQSSQQQSGQQYYPQPQYAQGQGQPSVLSPMDVQILREIVHPKKSDEEEKAVANAVSIPEIKIDVKLPEIEESKAKFISLKYPLIPRSGKGRVFSYANIIWDDTGHQFVYKIVEPELSPEKEVQLKRIKDFIQEKVDVDFTKLRKRDSIRYINGMFNDALNYFKMVETEQVKDVLRYYIFRDFIGLEKLEPMLQDPNLEDISCDGVGIPIYVYHKDSRFGSMISNRFFRPKEELDNFVMKVAERCGKTISVARPLLDGTLTDGSRVQATLESDIARRGSNFTIRKFSEKPLTPIDLLRYGSMDLTMMAYCWLAIEYGSSLLISGGTASGKTTILNAMSLFIKPQLKIVSIEDTAEIRLAHPHWISEVARVPIATTKKEIDLYELLRESLRQRPDYIIVGEVRGQEAYVLFQQIALGHGGLATIHSESFSKLVDRLTTAPISLPGGLLRNLDCILFVERIKQKGKYLRRVTSISEVAGIDDSEMPIPNEIMRWNSFDDNFSVKSKSLLLRKISSNAGISDAEMKREFDDRAKILCWMIRNNINDYVKVSSIFNLFYNSREYLMERIGEVI
jgi:flagellar protein FlaI